MAYNDQCTYVFSTYTTYSLLCRWCIAEVEVRCAHSNGLGFMLLENGGVLFPQARSVLVGDNIIRACMIPSCLCRVTVAQWLTRGPWTVSKPCSGGQWQCSVEQWCGARNCSWWLRANRLLCCSRVEPRPWRVYARVEGENFLTKVWKICSLIIWSLQRFNLKWILCWGKINVPWHLQSSIDWYDTVWYCWLDSMWYIGY